MGTKLYSQNTSIIKATNLPKFDIYTKPLNAEYTYGWGDLVCKLNLFSSSTLSPQGGNNYNASNMSDGNLNTAWVEGDNNYGTNVSISFKIDTGYYNIHSDSYDYFNGKLHFINGIYKTETLFKYNSRIKKMALYLNKELICEFNLNDYRGVQRVDLTSYFDFSNIDVNTNSDDGIITLKTLVEKYKLKYDLNVNGKFKLKTNDVFELRILDIFQGEKWKDTGLTEFFCY